MMGSTARREGTPSWVGYRKQRDDLIRDRVLIEDDDPKLYRFTEDTPFPSPSAAANVILARQSNGRLEWKSEASGKTYADWHEEKLGTIGSSP